MQVAQEAGAGIVALRMHVWTVECVSSMRANRSLLMLAAPRPLDHQSNIFILKFACLFKQYDTALQKVPRAAWNHQPRGIVFF